MHRTRKRWSTLHDLNMLYYLLVITVTSVTASVLFQGGQCAAADSIVRVIFTPESFPDHPASTHTSLAKPDPHMCMHGGGSGIKPIYMDLSHCNHECSPIRLQNKQSLLHYFLWTLSLDTRSSSMCMCKGLAMPNQYTTSRGWKWSGNVAVVINVHSWG